jgi:protein TonB
LILKVEEHQKAGLASFDEVQNEISSNLFNPRFAPELRRYLTARRQSAFLEIKPGYEDTGAAPGKNTAWVDPAEIKPETGLEAGFERSVGGIEGGIVGGVAGGITGGIPEPPPPPPPPPAAPVRVGGNIKAPQKVKHVNPVYPPIAQSARVQGVVIIEATIGPDGAVKDAKVLRSIPLLDAAALDAVRQWQFTPTLLNGVPVPVIMTVTVQFTLQ